jgi:hypothetical protein
MGHEIESRQGISGNILVTKQLAKIARAVIRNSDKKEYKIVITALAPDSKEVLDRLDNSGTLTNGVTVRRLSIVMYFHASSYIAVPARATLLSSVVLVPYMTLVPVVCMSFRCLTWCS